MSSSMRHTRGPRGGLIVPLLLLAACDGGGESVEIASPYDLRVAIVQGKGMRSMVRDPAAPAEDPNLTSDPVTVQVSVASPGYDRLAGAGGTGPALEVRLPPVEIHWKTLDPRWCQAWLATTPLVDGDTANNFLRRPTLAGDCRLVAEGVSGGRVFDADTAVVTFTPGPVARVEVPPRARSFVPWPIPVALLVDGAWDAHGNRVRQLDVRATLLRGAPALTLEGDSLLRSVMEGIGAVRLAIGPLTREVEVWVMQNLTVRQWRVDWACYDLALPGGAHADSVHYRLDEASGGVGAFLAPGQYVSFRGTLTTRTWHRGEPMRQTVVPGTSLSAVQRPFTLVWPTGQTAAAMPGGGYQGGTLCEAPAGSAWGRTSPVRVENLGPLPPS